MEKNKSFFKNRRLENVKNNPIIAPKILYTKEKQICSAYISKIKSNCKKQIILWLIPNKEKDGCYYVALKKLPTLLRGISSIHHVHFYCLYYLHSSRTEINLNPIKSM